MFISRIQQSQVLLLFAKTAVHRTKVQRVHSVSVFYRRSFCSSTNMRDTTVILSNLRALMKNLPNNQGSIDAYIIPTEDAHQSEYICQHDERRQYLTGFTGSAGTAIVTHDHALLWTDGRYYLQASHEIDSNWTLMKDGLPLTPKIEEWIAKNLKPGSIVGADANLLSSRAWNPLHTELDRNEIVLRAIEENLVDKIWSDQPKSTSKKIISLSIEYAGKTINEKLKDIRLEMIENKVGILVVTALDEVAWLLNLRGSDIDYNPVFFAYVIVTLDDIYCFVDSSKLPDNYAEHLLENQVNIIIEKYENVKGVLKELAEKTNSKVWIWLGSSRALAAVVPDKKRLEDITPVAVMKSIKNEVEAAGIRACHIRDGVALCKYFAWLEKTINSGEYVDEIIGATKLENFRKEQEKFMGLSFPTISSSGPNGSIIHYHPENETNRQLKKDEIYLCDSGAQYLDGTTDVTRTWHYGTPTDYQIECYTRVLKGQIGLGSTIFPCKIKGSVLDTLARKALWDIGLDYRHGTGHGIGHFLNVHEGPMGIGIRSYPDDPGLRANMFLSNEPGFYENEQFGLRIEDIVQIVPATSIKGDFNGRGGLTFKTVTMCPIQTKMVDVKLMTEKERNYLNAYHKTVLDTIGPILKVDGDELTLEWLRKETCPI